LQCHRPYILGESLVDPEKPCQACGGKIGQRKDDTPEGVHKRYQIFLAETLPVIEHFRKEGLLLEVDGNQTAADVARKLKENLA
jgi:adenylate kinase